MSERLRIGFVSNTPVQDRWSGSGLPFSVTRALNIHCGDVIELGPFPPVEPHPIKQLAWKIERKLTGRYHKWNFTHAYCTQTARQVREALARHDCDIIFTSYAGTRVALLEDERPLFVFMDATIRGKQKMGGYIAYERLVKRSAREAYVIEGGLLERATAILVPSQWARRSVMNDYHIDGGKVFVTPYGANMLPEEVPPREAVLRKRGSGRCRLLFVGKSWQRKRGDVVLATLMVLEELGIPAQLTVVGCRPPEGVVHPGMEVIPFLDKNDPAEARQLFDLFQQADFFIMPSWGETFGIVYAEASAFGLPSVATDVGGVSDAVRDGVNGVVLPAAASPEAYAQAIAEIYRDEARYNRLVRSSRELYEQELNWDAWGRLTAECMVKVLPAPLAQKVGPNSN